METLHRIMAVRALSVAELAARTGCSRQWLSSVLNGRRPLSRVLAERIARALGVEATDIVPAPDQERCP